jgi:hypothetical protein
MEENGTFQAEICDVYTHKGTALFCHASPFLPNYALK